MRKILYFLLILPFFINAQILTEGFEGLTFPPANWTRIQVNPNQTWKTTSNALSGAQSAIVVYDENLLLQNEDLITPTIDLSTETSATLSFLTASSYYWGVSPNNNYDITVSISTDGGTNWTELWNEDDLAAAEGGEFTNFTAYPISLDLTPYVGNANVKLKFNYYGTDGASWAIDNINVASCSDPIGFDLTNVTSTSCELTWADAGDYELEWGVYPYTQGSGGSTATVTGATSYNFTSLSPETSYTVFIRKNCGNGEYSNWVSTLAGTYPDPITTYPNSNNLEPEPYQTLFVNLFTRVSTTGTWQFGQDNPTGTDPALAQSPVSFVYSGIFSDADQDNWIFFGPYQMEANGVYNLSFGQRVFSDAATTVPMDLEVAVSTTNDGMGTTVIGTYNGLSNITYTTQSASYTPTESGTYYIGFHNITATATGATTGNLVIIDDIAFTETMGVDDINYANGVSTLYPNPVRNVLNIHLSEQFEASNTKITITDLNGRNVMNALYSENLDVSNLDKGVYIITITDGTNTENQKLIKE